MRPVYVADSVSEIDIGIVARIQKFALFELAA